MANEYNTVGDNMSDDTKEVVCRVCQVNKVRISSKGTSGVCLICVSGGALVVPVGGLKQAKKPRIKRVTALSPKREVIPRTVPFGALAVWVREELAKGKNTKEIFSKAKLKWPEYEPSKLRSTVHTTKSRMKGKEGQSVNGNIQSSVPTEAQAANPVGAVEAKPGAPV